MILDLPGFDKITDQISIGFIQCFNEEKKKKRITNQPFQFLIEGPLSQKKQPVVTYKQVLTV